MPACMRCTTSMRYRVVTVTATMATISSMMIKNIQLLRTRFRSLDY